MLPGPPADYPFQVLHVTQLSLAAANGVHRSAWGMARSQVELGLKASIISLGASPTDSDLAVAAEHGVEIHRLNRVGPRSVSKLLSRFPPDRTIVHTHGAFDPPITLFSRLAKRFKVVRTPHGSIDAGVFARRSFRKIVYWQLVERASFSRSDMIHLVGPSEVATLRKYDTRAPWRFIPNGVFPEDVNPILARRPPRFPSILFIGRFDLEQKAIDVMIGAAAEVPELRVTLVGNDYAGGRRWAADEIARLGLAGRVSIHDPVFDLDEKRALMATHDAFVHVSRWEGMPNACLEAASSGMPLIVTPGTNLADHVRDAGSGWVAAEATVPAATAALRQFVAERDQVPARGAASVDMIRSRFLWSRLATQFAAMYQEVIGRSAEVG